MELDGKRDKGVHASEVSDCLRHLVYTMSYEREPEPNSTFWRRKFEVGHTIHRMVQSNMRRWARNSGEIINFVEEVVVSPKVREVAALFDIYSSADGIITIRDRDGYEIFRVLLEIKTKSEKEFKDFVEPEKGHIDQAHVYMAALNIPFTWFFYWDKGTHNYTSSAAPNFMIPFDQQHWNKLEKRIDEAGDYRDAKELPDREEGFHCTLCPWKRTCGPDYTRPKLVDLSAPRTRTRRKAGL